MGRACQLRPGRRRSPYHQSESVRSSEAMRFAMAHRCLYGRRETFDTKDTSPAPRGLALVVDQPLAARLRAGVVDPPAGSGAPERHRLGRIGDVFLVRRPAGLGLRKAQLQSGFRLERLRLTAHPLTQPAGQACSRRHGVRARPECRHRARFRLRRAVLEVLVEERPEDLLAEGAAVSLPHFNAPSALASSI